MIPKWFCPCIFSIVLFFIASGLVWFRSDFWLAFFLSGALFLGLTLYLMIQDYYEDKRKEWERD